jgi:catenin alpha
MDVINAAKMISECGSKLNKIAKDIAAQVHSLISSRKLPNLIYSSVLNLNQNLILLLMSIVNKTFYSLLSFTSFLYSGITLYCHQLDITSKVKADVQNISGELIVSGVSVLFRFELKNFIDLLYLA